MKHLEPLMTHLSPCLVAVVFMPETSEPASGSVRQKEASLGASVSMPRYSFLISSEPPRATGVAASPFAIREVPMPEQPQPISSSIRQPERKSRPGPPYSSGMWVFMRPTSHALLMTSWGHVPSLSYSQATGRISFSAKLCASSRMSFCSSVSVKSTTGAPCSQRGRGGASPEVLRQLIDSSVNVRPQAYPQQADKSRTPLQDRVSGAREARSKRVSAVSSAASWPRAAVPSAADQHSHDDVDAGRDGHYREQDQADLLGIHGWPAGGHRPAAKAAPHAPDCKGGGRLPNSHHRCLDRRDRGGRGHVAPERRPLRPHRARRAVARHGGPSGRAAARQPAGARRGRGRGAATRGGEVGPPGRPRRAAARS